MAVLLLPQHLPELLKFSGDAGGLDEFVYLGAKVLVAGRRLGDVQAFDGMGPESEEYKDGVKVEMSPRGRHGSPSGSRAFDKINEGMSQRILGLFVHSAHRIVCLHALCIIELGPWNNWR